MSDWIGKSIAHYRVHALIGVGGMGEVYRGSDSRLDREVAIKLLPAEFARDPERLARLEREAKLLASLNHPNIAAIHGLEESDGVRALAMELVEGQSLSERIAGGPIPVEETLALAKQMAEALEYAHERGIIHRDLKPANIKLSRDGQIKLLDFGLAKALIGEAAESKSALANSPTLTAASTQLGLILGTAAYMPPEQARGKPVDRRADIWSFGVVLFEMLSGRQLFGGETVSETLAQVMRDDPDWSALPPETPPRLRRLIQRCLIKDPKQRLRDVGEARVTLEEIIAGEQEPSESTTGSATATRRRPSALALTNLSLGAITLGLLAGYRIRPVEHPPLLRATLTLPEGMEIDQENKPLTLSPDGKMLVIAAGGSYDPQSRLWLRRLDRAEFTPLPGTDDASYPFWSPDGKSLGFFAHHKLQRVSLSGGVPQTICEALDGRGGSWSSKGMIAFAPLPLSGLMLVPADGGTPRALTETVKDRTDRHPQFLPDGEHLLFVRGSSKQEQDAEILTMDLATNRQTHLFDASSHVTYLDQGYLAYVSKGLLMAQPFDPSKLSFSGDPITLAENVVFNTLRMTGSFSLARNGTMVYSNIANLFLGQITWLDLAGNELGKLDKPAATAAMRVSPDGRTLVMTRFDRGRSIWKIDLTKRSDPRILTAPGAIAFPVWSKDSSTIYFTDGAGRIFAQPANGSRDAVAIVTIAGQQLFPECVTPDGKSLLFGLSSPGSGVDLYLQRLDSSEKPKSLVTGPGDQQSSSLSPNGRWLAYNSSESVPAEVIVTSFPSLSTKLQISNGGGIEPVWSPDGKALFYRSADDKLIRVALTEEGSGLEVGSAETMLSGHPLPNAWTLAPDGKRLLVVVPQSNSVRTTLELVTDWTQLIDRRRE